MYYFLYLYIIPQWRSIQNKNNEYTNCRMEKDVNFRAGEQFWCIKHYINGLQQSKSQRVAPSIDPASSLRVRRLLSNFAVLRDSQSVTLLEREFIPIEKNLTPKQAKKAYICLHFHEIEIWLNLKILKSHQMLWKVCCTTLAKMSDRELLFVTFNERGVLRANQLSHQTVSVTELTKIYSLKRLAFPSIPVWLQTDLLFLSRAGILTRRPIFFKCSVKF